MVELLYRLSQEEGLIAYQCTDAQGLCLQSVGSSVIVNSQSTGYIASLANRSKVLDPTLGGEFPVILIESDQYDVLIQKNGSLTVAAYKKPATSKDSQIDNPPQ